MIPDNLTNIKDRIVQTLKSNGISILYYESYTTNSMYLKLDSGLLNTIRISDHTGKKNLNYRYEIGPHISETHTDYSKKYPSHLFTENDVDLMLSRILADKDSKLEKYSSDGYKSIVQRNARDHANDKGFWKQARPI